MAMDWYIGCELRRVDHDLLEDARQLAFKCAEMVEGRPDPARSSEDDPNDRKGQLSVPWNPYKRS
jgi:hypothetical protein